jgi:iron complex outermembrane receptor protein
MKHLFTALLTFSAFTNFLHAESMEEVVVTSSLLESSKINNPLYVIDGEEIIDGATTSLGEAVDSYLGVSIADFGSAVGQPIIRGMSGPRVKILKNGMVNRDVSSLGADHLNDLDLNNIQQIEIIKGPSSLLYANGSIGGIINVVDDCIAEIDFAGSEFAAGYEKQSVNDGTAQNFNFKDNLGGFNVNFGYSKIELGNFDVPDGAILHEEEHEGEEEEHEEENLGFVSNSDYMTEATKFGISKAGDWGYLGFSVDNLESVYGIPFHGEEHEEHEGEEEEHEEERIFSTTDSESFTVKGSLNMSGGLVNKVDFTFRDSDYLLTEDHAEEEHEEEEHEEEEHEEHEPTNFMSSSTEYGAIFDLSNKNMIQKFVFNVLDEDSSIIGEEAFMNPATSEEFTLGYFMSKDMGMYNVDFGVRMDQIERSGSVTDEDHGDIDYYNIDDTANSFAITLGKSLSDNLNVDLGFASVERLPSSVELFMNGPHLATGRFEVGDPNLSSETSNNLDVTFDYDNGDFFAYASFYINKVDNYITLMDEDEDHDDHGDDGHGDDDHGDDDHGDDHDDHGHGNLIHSFYTQEDADFVGYELEFGRTIDLAAGELTYSFGRDQVNAEFADGHNVPRINPARNIYSLSYDQNDTIFKVVLKNVERQKDVGEGESETGSYRMLDTRLTKTFDINNKSEMKVTLFANNLLDDVARNHSSFIKDQVPLPGRNFGVKFKLSF